MTPQDAKTVDKFREFLAVAGPPDGKAGARLLAADRKDLLDWALGEVDDEALA